MILTDLSHAIRVITSGATTVTVYVSYVDHGIGYTHGQASASIASATTTSVLAGSPIYPTRQVLGMFVSNDDASATQTITIEYYNGSASRTLWKGTIGAGERVQYNGAFSVVNTSGLTKAAPINSPNASSVLVCPLFSTASLTGTRSITSTNSYAVYVGKAPRSLTSANIRYRVTTACATITWAEVALATGPINVGGGPTLTVRGYADVSGVANSTGQKTTSVPVSSGQAINEGDDLWAIFGNAATTVAVLRAQSIADDLQVGVFASLATRPSLNVGNAQAYTIDGATATAPWFAVVV